MPQTTILYSKEGLENALEECRNGVPIRTAARKYGIPKTTLLYKHKGKLPKHCRKGPATVLTEAEENVLVNWLFYIGSRGFPATKNQLLDSVELLVKISKRSTMFTNGRPGRKWYNSFMKRHPTVAERISQNLTASRALVSETKIRGWFCEVEQYIDTENLREIWNDPKRVFNADETAFFLSPKEEKVLVRKGASTVYSHINSNEKENLTTLMNVNAAGMIVPPIIVFKYQRIPPHIANLMPSGFGIAKSESGWMTGPTFYEYITNIFYPWLIKNNIEFPVVLFVDGHKSHLTMALSDFCTENKILLIALYPNATHILQPLDVAVFKPLKSKWKEEVRRWKIENNAARFKREHFGGVLVRAIENSMSKDTIASGFRCTGLFPLNPNAINFQKYFHNDGGEQEPITQGVQVTADLGKQCLAYMERFISEETLKEFKKYESKKWMGKDEDRSLFETWKRMCENIDRMTDKESTSADKNRYIEHENVVGNLCAEFAERSEENGNRRETENEEENRAQKVINNEEVNTENQIQSNLQDINEEEGIQNPYVEVAGNSENIGDRQETEDEEDNGARTDSSNIQKVCYENQDQLRHQDTNEDSPPTMCSNVPFPVPSPFKQCLFWPEEPKHPKPKRNKEKIPYVAVSDAWRAYHLKKQQRKDQNEMEKNERKRKREEKKADATQRKINKAKKRIIEDSSSDSSVEVQLERDSESTDWSGFESDSGDKDKNINGATHVIVRYNGKYYPGIITEKGVGECRVSVMNESGLNSWKWPVPKDEMWYKEDDIIEAISEPVAINRRGMFKVVELQKYGSFYMT